MSNAVYIQNVNFSYGTTQILRNFSARIHYSQIYALLGPSGGGKTTLLKLILGRLKPQQGEISVLGLPPGGANSTISFMPQEIGLCPNFTINQTLNYFKLVYQISNEEFYNRRKILTKLCNLPDGHRLVSQLSGGTQRRLSIVVSLINNPSLVILDEPTVGIDALLRNQIWNYLVGKVKEGMTIIIVTHYIEEAANAGRVGLMRNGALLAEDNPQRLMAMYQEPNLEAVFLKLCCLEDRGVYCNTSGYYEKEESHQQLPPFYNYQQYAMQKVPPPPSNDSNNNSIFIIPTYTTEIDANSRSSASLSTSTSASFFDTKQWTTKFWILLTLVNRNFAKFFYSYFSIIIILLPATQALIYCLAVSKETVPIKAAIFNEEVGPGHGKALLDELKPFRHHRIEQITVNSLEEAQRAVESNQALGAIWIPANYTDSLEARVEEGFEAENGTVDDSTIRLYIDNSAYMYSLELVNALLKTFTDFAKKTFHSRDTNMLEMPITVETTELSRDYRFSDYYMPGYFLLFMYISQITMASLTLTQECKDGLFERSLIAGVSHELVYFSHIITSFILSLLQLLLLDVTAFVFFDSPSHSSVWLRYSFFLLESLNAMSLGFVISSLISNELACLILVWFVTIPQILSSGIFWPLESLAKPVNYLFHLWPLTAPVKTIRHILLQGWDLSNQQVQYGFLSSGIPMIFFFYLALLIFKFK